jgi:hypothetical protein
MNEEDEAFNEIERQAKQRKESVRAAMLKVEDKWIETNNSVCALLRQAHDVLAMSSLPPKRKWVGLTVEEIDALGAIYAEKDRKIQMWGLFAVAIEEKLKEKNT